MATDVLRGAVQDEIRAELQRAQQRRRCQRRIDHARRLGSARRRQDEIELGDVERGICERVEPEHVRALELGDHGLCVDGVDLDEIDHPAPGALRQQVPKFDVRRAPNHHPRPDLEAVEDRRRRGHARAEGDRGAGFELAERLLERLPGRIRAPRVARPVARSEGRSEDGRLIQRVAGATGPTGDDGERRRVQLCGPCAVVAIHL